MLRILQNPQFDFMRRRKAFLTFSGLLVAISFALLATKGLDRGIEFSGGTQIQVKYSSTPDIGAIRSALLDAGLTAQVTTIGNPDQHEVDIRLADAEGTEVSDEQTNEVLAALRRQAGATGDRQDDLHVIDADVLSRELAQKAGLDTQQAAEVAKTILAKRTELAMFRSFDELADLPGMTPGTLSYLEANKKLGPIALRSQSYIGPAIGRELIGKALAAIFGSLIGMLVYIWVRFQLQWGFAAVVALAHDTIITLGLFSLFDKELSLAVVAAFLTLVGYSVNDTVVVFDRIRENLRNRGAETVEQTINRSINQTLSRTVITSGLTWIAVFGIYLFGGSALQPFAFVLTVGVIVGTYSSIYVAAPFLVFWTEWLAKRRRVTATKVPARSNAS